MKRTVAPLATLNVSVLFAALDAIRESRGQTWREVAAESGLSASSLTRLGQGKRIDVDSLASLAAWSNLNVTRFFVRRAKRATESES